MKTETIKQALNKAGVTFASMVYNTEIATAAKHKAINIKKVTTANVQLFQSVKDDIYRNAVIRTANNIKENGEVKEFETSETWYLHDDEVYSIIHHKKSGEDYLYFIANNAKSQYYINDKPVEKKEIEQYLTASKAKELFDTSETVYNKTNDVYHTVKPRTLKIDNIIELKTNGQVIC